MVGGSNHYGIDVGTGKQFFVTDVHGELVLDFMLVVVFLDALFKAVALDVVDVASGYDTYVGDGDETVHQVDGLLAETDETDVNHIVCATFLALGGCRCSKGIGC